MSQAPKRREESPDTVIIEPDSNHDKRIVVRFVWHRVFDGAYGVVAIVEGSKVYIKRYRDKLAVYTSRGVYTARKVKIFFKSLYDIERHTKVCSEDTGCIYVFYSASTVY